MPPGRRPVVSLLSSPAFLAGAVLLLVGVWVVFVLTRQSGSGAPEAFTFELPRDLGDRSAVLGSAEQLAARLPNAKNVGDGVRLLRFLKDALTPDEWPKAAPAVYVGWQRIHKTPGSQLELEPFAAELLERMAPHLGRAELEGIIRSSNGNDYYKPGIDTALERLAARPVPASGYAGSRLADLVAASVGAGDPERAARYLERSRVEEGAAQGVRLEMVRVSRVLGLHLGAKAGKPEPRAIIQEWAKAPEDPQAGPLLLGAGVALARAGKFARDYRLLGESIAATQEEEGAGKYWGEVLRSFVDGLPEKGRYREADTLEALAKLYGEHFKDPAFEHEFWRKQAEGNPHKDTAEAMWRVECLKKAYAAAPDDALRLEHVRKLVGEYEAFGEHQAPRKLLEALLPRLEGEVAKVELSVIVADLRKKEAQDQILAARRRKEQELQMLRGQAEQMKMHLTQMKKAGAPAEAIANMERSIRELERKLPE